MLENLQTQTRPFQVFTAADAQRIDDYAIHQLQRSAHELMHTAGNLAWQQANQLWPELKTVVCLCGPGNNGGDGWVIAAAAQAAGKNTFVITHAKTKEPGKIAQSSKSCAEQMRAVVEPLLPSANLLYFDQANVEHHAIEQFLIEVKSSIAEEDNTLFVDALFGIGLNKALSAGYKALIEFVNQQPGKRLALDVPSGIDSTTGHTFGSCFRADVTVTFIVAKRGLFRNEGRAASGTLFLASLGLAPQDILAKESVSTNKVFLDYISAQDFKFREMHSHKGHFGTLACIGGDEGMGGAIIIASESAARFGAGKVIVGTLTAHGTIAITRCPSIMSQSLDELDRVDDSVADLLNNANALVLGPGLGQGAWGLACLTACLKSTIDKPYVLDADALNLIATDDQAYQLMMQRQTMQPAIQSTAHPNNMPLVITPHPKEAQRLLDRLFSLQALDRDAININDPFDVAFALSHHFNCVCLLKGHGTIVAYKNQAYLCQTGNAALAKAGQGDCLSGMIGALVAQKIPAFKAARQAAWAHGLASETWSRSQSELSLMPHETASIAAWAVNRHRESNQTCLDDQNACLETG